MPLDSPRRTRRLPTAAAPSVALFSGMPGGRRSFEKDGKSVERPADPAVRKANFDRIVRLFRPYRGRLAAAAGLILFSAGVGVVSPFLLRAVLDTAIPEKRTGLLTVLVAGTGGVPRAPRPPRGGTTPARQ